MKTEKTDENSGHYVIASSRPPERRPLVPIMLKDAAENEMEEFRLEDPEVKE